MKCVEEEVFEVSNNHGFTWFLVRLFGMAIIPGAPLFWLWCIRESGHTGGAVEHQTAVQDIMRTIAGLATLIPQIMLWAFLLGLV